LLRRHRDMMLFRVGEHAVQRAGDDGLVAHEMASVGSRGKKYPRSCAPTSGRFLRQAAVGKVAPPAMVNREIARARQGGGGFQAIKPADGMAEMGGVGIADVLREMREVEVLIGEMQQMPRALPGVERAERDAGLLLEEMQKARCRQPRLRRAACRGQRL